MRHATLRRTAKRPRTGKASCDRGRTGHHARPGCPAGEQAWGYAPLPVKVRGLALLAAGGCHGVPGSVSVSAMSQSGAIHSSLPAHRLLVALLM